MATAPAPVPPAPKKSVWYDTVEQWIEAEWSDWRSFVALHPNWATGIAFAVGIFLGHVL